MMRTLFTGVSSKRGDTSYTGITFNKEKCNQDLSKTIDKANSQNSGYKFFHTFHTPPNIK